METQNFIIKIKMDKVLNESIGNIYEGFLNMMRLKNVNKKLLSI